MLTNDISVGFPAHVLQGFGAALYLLGDSSLLNLWFMHHSCSETHKLGATS